MEISSEVDMMAQAWAAAVRARTAYVGGGLGDGSSVGGGGRLQQGRRCQIGGREGDGVGILQKERIGDGGRKGGGVGSEVARAAASGTAAVRALADGGSEDSGVGSVAARAEALGSAALFSG